MNRTYTHTLHTAPPGPHSPTTSSLRACAAALIFTPRLLKSYLRFQRLQPSFSIRNLGALPSAGEYTEFLAWTEGRHAVECGLDRFGVGTGSGPKAEGAESPMLTSDLVVASRCGHLLHPASASASKSPSAQSPPTTCPVCTIRAHMAYMKHLTAIKSALEIQTPQSVDMDAEPVEPNPHRQAIDDVYRAAKLSFVRVVYSMEGELLREREWDAEHAGVQTKNIKSIAEALELYWGGDRLGEGGEVREVRQGGKEKNGTGRKSVSFSEGTEFGVGRMEYCFRRGHPRYEAGKWCVGDEVGDGVMEDLMENVEMEEEEVESGEVEESSDEGEDEETEDDDEGEDDDEDEEDADDDEEDDFECDEDTSFIIFGD